jgi:hypothetical protein
MADPLQVADAGMPPTPPCTVPTPPIDSSEPAAKVTASTRRRAKRVVPVMLLALGALGVMVLIALGVFHALDERLDRIESAVTTPPPSGEERAVVRLKQFEDTLVFGGGATVAAQPQPTFTYSVPTGMPMRELLPVPPGLKPPAGPALDYNLAHVSEVAFGVLPNKLTLPGNRTPREELARQVVKIAHLNKNRSDGFMEALVADRADLSGLPLMMGDACRMNEERARLFELALNAVRQAENQTASQQQPMADIADAFWNQFLMSCRKEDQAYAQENAALREQVALARMAALTQVLAPKSAFHRRGLVQYLAGVPHVEATQALAKLVLFSAEAEVRDAAVEALQVRRDADSTAVLLSGLSYPWPPVAGRAAAALVKLQRKDAVPQLVALLDAPDPRAPVMQEVNGEEVPVVRELVKLNHHRNCLLCHAPGANAQLDQKDVSRNLPQESLTAAIAVPGESLPTPSQGYRAQPNDLVVRIDVTYLRQDFSAMLPVADAHPWPALQRFDFLVRSRVLTEAEAVEYRDQLAKQGAGAVTPYERAILSALRELTGRDTEPTAAAWRKLLALAAPGS